MSNTVENQKVVIISKEAADKDHPYSVINLEAFDKAAVELTKGGSFKLWAYLAKNQNKFKFALSRVDFCRWANVSTSTYHRAVEDLEDKGFLVQTKESSNIYTFYENPADKEIVTADDKEIQIPKKKIEETKEFHF